MAEKSRLFQIRIRGSLGCYARPELKTERVTYPTATPSGLRGLFESILWKPAVAWRIDEIRLLRPVKYIQFRRNEVNKRMSDGTANAIRKSGNAWNYYADEDRAQRNTIALKDIDYAIGAHMELTDRRGPDDNIRKFEEMFERRLEKGQHVTPPVLGCREFPAASVEFYAGNPAPFDHTEDFGWMLHDIRFGAEPQAVFFHAVMKNGCMTIPPLPEKGDIAS